MQVDKDQVQDDFEDFYEEVFLEFTKYGKIEEMNVCDNIGDHMVGNVYVKFEDEGDSAECLKYASAALTPPPTHRSHLRTPEPVRSRAGTTPNDSCAQSILR